MWYVYDKESADIQYSADSYEEAKRWRADRHDQFLRREISCPDGQGPLLDWALSEAGFYHEFVEANIEVEPLLWHAEPYRHPSGAVGPFFDHVGVDKTPESQYNRVIVNTKEHKMETVTLRGEDFKTIHNTLCDLRNLVARMERSMIKTSEFDRIIEGFQMGLKDAYEQDNGAFDRKMDYYRAFQQENGLKSIWSIFELEEHGFLLDHPWQGAKVLVYYGTTVPIEGPTWADLYRAADLAIEQSGDDHHMFIEGFGRYATDNSMLELTTGS
jgi:hypothetical protein